MDKVYDNEVQKELPVIGGAIETVERIQKIIPIVAYLTIRPESVSEGTAFWLEKYHFPQAQIIARPVIVEKSKGHQWKAEVLEYLYPQVAGIIDDNTSIVQYFNKTYKGVIFAYSNNEVPKSDIKVLPCPAWEDVYKQVVSFSLSGRAGSGRDK